MSDRGISPEDIRREREREVDQRAHWAYLIGVLAGGALLMLALIAALDGLS
jgi:hypothetical protein